MVRYLSLSHYFILFFVVVWLSSTLIVPGYASGVKDKDTEVSKELFELTIIQDVKGPDGDGGGASSTKITLNEIKPPFLFFSAKEGVRVAVAETKYEKNNGAAETKFGVVTKYLKATNNKEWNEEEIKGNWETQLATKEEEYSENDFFITRAAVVNGNKNKVYLFLTNFTNDTENQEWKIKLIEGTVDAQKQGSNLITWCTKQSVKLDTVKQIKTNLKENNLKLSLLDGAAFLTKDNEIVYVLKSKSTGNDNKYVTVFFQYDEAGKLDLLYNESTTSLYSFFQWQGEIFKAPTTDVNGDGNRMMMFNAKQKSFTETNGPIARLRDFLKDKHNFFTATIEEKQQDVLLFTQRKNIVNGNKNVFLWMTDGTRVALA